MFFSKLKTVPATALSYFVRETDAADKKRVYVAALKRASEAQNAIVARAAPLAKKAAG